MRNFFNVKKAERVLYDLKIFYNEQSQDLNAFDILCKRVQDYLYFLEKRDQKTIISKIYGIATNYSFSDEIRGRALELMISMDGKEKVILWLQARYYMYEATRRGVTWCLKYIDEPPYTHKKNNFYQKPFPF